MRKEDESYFINNPVLVKYNQNIGPFRIRHWMQLKSVSVNERIVEHPFAIHCLQGVSRGAQVLDVGCRESSLPLQVAGLGYRVTGIDLRTYPYQHPNFTFLLADILKMPFDKEFFDVVLSVSTIEHIGLGAYNNPTQAEGADVRAVEEIFRVLKPGGIFCMTAPFGKARIDKHQRVYDRKGIEKLLKNFYVEEIRCFIEVKLSRSRAAFWEEMTPNDGNSIDDRKNSVCLVKAIKRPQER